MSQNLGQDDEPFEPYRRYLQFLARAHLASSYQNKVDPSDIVQQTLLQAHLARDQYRGTTEKEKLGWLRVILIHQVKAAVRHLNARRRDFKRECSIEQDIETTSMRLNDFLVSARPTPSEQISARERSVAFAEAIEELPEKQRRVLMLKYWQEKTLREIADELELSISAVAGLVYRATKELRRKLNE